MFKKLIGLIAAAGAMGMAVPAGATTFIFTGNTSVSGSSGNQYTTTVDGITVTASGWYVSGTTSSTLPQKAYLGRYSNGMGVTSSGENGTSNANHAIDNVGKFDFVRLTFSEAVSLTGLNAKGYDVNSSSSTIDTDAWISYGIGDYSFDTQSEWQGYLTRGTPLSNINSGTTVSSPNFSKVWLIGAAITNTDRDDGFKLKAVQVIAAETPQALPEPGTWLTMMIGFGMMGSALRRRTKAAAGSPATAA